MGLGYLYEILVVTSRNICSSKVFRMNVYLKSFACVSLYCMAFFSMCSSVVFAGNIFTLKNSRNSKERIRIVCDYKMHCKFEEFQLTGYVREFSTKEKEKKIANMSPADIKKAAKKIELVCRLESWFSKRDKERLSKACQTGDVKKILFIQNEIDSSMCVISQYNYFIDFIAAGKSTWIGQRSVGGLCDIAKSYKLTKKSEFVNELVILKLSVTGDDKRCLNIGKQIPDKAVYISELRGDESLAGCRYLNLYSF